MPPNVNTRKTDKRMPKMPFVKKRKERPNPKRSPTACEHDRHDQSYGIDIIQDYSSLSEMIAIPEKHKREKTKFPRKI